MVSVIFENDRFNMGRLAVVVLNMPIAQQITPRKDIQLLKKNWVDACPQIKDMLINMISFICHPRELGSGEEGL